MRPASEEDWLALWQRLGGSTASGSAVYRELKQRHEEPHRAYHTLHHIAFCLAEFGPVRSAAVSPDSVELAIWFHDSVYDTHATDNEERSADLFSQIQKNYALPSQLEMEVRSLILATKHQGIPAGLDAKLLVDIDLAVLGQPESIFAEYERQVRREYAWVPDPQFAAGRSKILKSFLDRSSIYQTSHFTSRYETQARHNLEKTFQHWRMLAECCSIELL